MNDLYKKIRKTVSPVYRHWEMLVKIAWYRAHVGRIIESVRQKGRIRVAFLTVNLSMWKCEELFRLLLEDDLFDPVMVPMPRPMFNWEAEKEEQNRLMDYCRQNGFPYIPGYDYDKNTFNGYEAIKPDVVFYSQPYSNASYKAHRVEEFWKKCIFFYVPYCFIIENKAAFVDTLYVNICQNVFLENEMVRSIECGMATNKGRNFIVTGYLGARKLLVHDESDSQAWKMQSTDVKRIIWAPHHSILNKDILNYSNFLDIADDMLSLAHEYNGRVQFAFKPHPGLKPKLYDHPEWGKERTDRYYAEWNDMPNSILAEGSYERLFRSSDAMIHDCSSFTVEYLYTGNPVMYVTKDDHLDYLNDFGKACFDVHYKGKTISDIRSFIDNVVLDGQDPMRMIRSEFVDKNLMLDDMRTPEQIIADIMKNVCVYGK